MAAGVKMFPEYCASLDTLLPLIGDSSCLLPVDHIQKRRSSPPQLAFLGKAGEDTSVFGPSFGHKSPSESLLFQIFILQ